MSARFFLDTNIFVSSFDSIVPGKAARARELIRGAVGSREGVVSYQIVQEFFDVALNRFAIPMTVFEADSYLVTVFRPLLAVHSSEALYGEALRLMGRHSFSWRDSLVVAAAVQSECSVLYSEDLKHGLQVGMLKILNPFPG